MALKRMIDANRRKKQRLARRKAAQNMAFGAAAGIAVGGALGLLLAPKAGKETREEIAVGVKDFAGLAKGKLGDAKDKWNEAAEKVKGRLKGFEDKFAEGAEEAGDIPDGDTAESAQPDSKE